MYCRSYDLFQGDQIDQCTLPFPYFLYIISLVHQRKMVRVNELPNVRLIKLIHCIEITRVMSLCETSNHNNRY